MLLHNIHNKRERAKKRAQEEDNRTFSTNKALKRYEHSEEDQKQKKNTRNQTAKYPALYARRIFNILWIFINEYMGSHA